MRAYFHQWLRSRYSLLFFALPLIMAIAGPFGTYTDLTFGPRLLYWTVLVFGIGAIMMLCNALVLSVSHTVLGALPRVVIGSAIAAIPGALLVAWMHQTMRSTPFPQDIMPYVIRWAQVWMLGTIISLAELLRMRIFAPDVVPVTHVDLAPVERPNLETDISAEDKDMVKALRTALHDKLDHSRTEPEDIVSLSMQDHYVEVTSDQGSTLLLMRMVDAIEALDGLDGLRIHRSHWVAKTHMRRLTREQNRTFLTLSDGRKLAVSRTYLDDVSAALRASEQGSITDP